MIETVTRRSHRARHLTTPHTRPRVLISSNGQLIREAVRKGLRMMGRVDVTRMMRKDPPVDL
jgi:hypothetical protein